MTRATSLQVIHLCGNEGITTETVEWLRRRIRAKDDVEMPNILPHEKTYSMRPDEEKSPPPQKSALSNLLAGRM